MAKRLGDLSLYIRLMRQARPYWPHLVALCALSVVGSLVKLLTPLPLLLVTDYVIGNRPLSFWLVPYVDTTLPGSAQILALAIG
jgi:hypothetical protein